MNEHYSYQQVYGHYRQYSILAGVYLEIRIFAKHSKVNKDLSINCQIGDLEK